MDSATVSLEPTVLSADAINQLPDIPLGTRDGVEHKVLWRNQASMAGLLTVKPGHRLGMHAHRVHHHHIWVLHGRAVILGKELGVGSYVHVPYGVDHDLDATATDGCTVFYLYIRHE
jgi:quercetin dioxygenase-like cupin family protein